MYQIYIASCTTKLVFFQHDWDKSTPQFQPLSRWVYMYETVDGFVDPSTSTENTLQGRLANPPEYHDGLANQFCRVGPQIVAHQYADRTGVL